jgi:hypothetical protein
MRACPSGKRQYINENFAEEALIEAHVQFSYRPGSGPVAVYQCEDCGQWHLTSKGPVNLKLSQLLKEGKIKKQKEVQYWVDKLKK